MTFLSEFNIYRQYCFYIANPDLKQSSGPNPAEPTVLAWAGLKRLTLQPQIINSPGLGPSNRFLVIKSFDINSCFSVRKIIRQIVNSTNRIFDKLWNQQIAIRAIFIAPIFHNINQGSQGGPWAARRNSTLKPKVDTCLE